MNNTAERKQTVLIAGDERSVSLAPNYWLIKFYAGSESGYVCIETVLRQHNIDRICIWLTKRENIFGFHLVKVAF